MEIVVLDKAPRNLFLLAMNIRSFFRADLLQFTYDSDSGFFRVAEPSTGLERFFLNKKRGAWLYSRGLRRRAEFLQSSYCLESVEFVDGDVVVDCGANVGDLLLSIGSRIDKSDYIAFEPNLEDFMVLSRNEPLAESHNLALGAAKGKMKLYQQTSRGDSTLIRPESFSSVVEVDVITLDDFVESRAITKIKLLKVEAEGFEPEVLSGALKSLAMCEYVAVDGGPERGPERTATFPELTNLLTGRGFELVGVYGPWLRGLFRRRGKA